MKTNSISENKTTRYVFRPIPWVIALIAVSWITYLGFKFSFNLDIQKSTSSFALCIGVYHPQVVDSDRCSRINP